MKHTNYNRMPGPGDEACWGPCTGDPSDPRSPDYGEFCEKCDEDPETCNNDARACLDAANAEAKMERDIDRYESNSYYKKDGRYI